MSTRTLRTTRSTRATHRAVLLAELADMDALLTDLRAEYVLARAAIARANRGDAGFRSVVFSCLNWVRCQLAKCERRIAAVLAETGAVQLELFA